MQFLTKQAMHKMLGIIILAFLPVMGFSEEADEGEKTFSRDQQEY